MSEVLSAGLDLGTSNSVLAVVSAQAMSEVVPIQQIESPGRIVDQTSLPSALYLPHEGEAAADQWRLPGGDSERYGVVGRYARDRGGLAPDRVVTSAKSWLCQRQVDPHEPILPWQSPIAEPRVSPVQASTRYLQEIRDSFVLRYGAEAAAAARLTLTVPASFDESARELTREAAHAAGWGELTLLEEPLAALYAWLERHAGDWRTLLVPGDIVLICDVGGGTTDLSLVAVAEREGELRLERVSVGEHILLGGDNMDLAIAHLLRQQLEDEGQAVDHWQFLGLVHSARDAKERMLLDETLVSLPIAIASRGSGLFAQSRTAVLERGVLSGLLLDGYFPLIGASEVPQRTSVAGLREIGLDYAGEPAITKHVAAFLRQSLANVRSDPSLGQLVGTAASSGELLLPTAVLFHGGVFKAPMFRDRIVEVCRSWGASSIRQLDADDVDAAVARGAASYGARLQRGDSLRIRAGIARSYYVGLERSAPAVPGLKPRMQALCIAPQGMEEGSEASVEGHAFGAVVGAPVEFRLFHSASRAGDQVGAAVADAERQLVESTAVRAELTAPAGAAPGAVVPVYLHARVSELGVLELSLQHRDSPARWALEFSVRQP